MEKGPKQANRFSVFGAADPDRRERFFETLERDIHRGSRSRRKTMGQVTRNFEKKTYGISPLWKKEARALKGALRGKNGWREGIEE